jgi:hypothetical protein
MPCASLWLQRGREVPVGGLQNHRVRELSCEEGLVVSLGGFPGLDY